jgi:3-methyladenine DNA glycosylase AlkC
VRPVAEPLKDHFDRALVESLAGRFAETDAGFDAATFTARVIDSLAPLELKDRINLVADELRTALPDDYATALTAVVAVSETEGVDGFSAWPLCSFVERHGLVDPTASLAAMERLTRQFSCEFAIRPFLDTHLDLTMTSLREWVRSDDEHVRRLPSEGTRPHLPWGPNVQALLDDPELGISLLEELRHDPSETVRRSVANHLNDVARRHPDRVVEICRRWSGEADTELSMIRHALRSLVKKGDSGAMALLGFTTDPAVDVESFAVTPPTIGLGESIRLAATIRSTASEPQRLVIDFIVHHIGASGASTPKVFKWTTVELAPGATTELAKTRKIATASTRRYNAGRHRVELQVAGRVMAESAFDLTETSG